MASGPTKTSHFMVPTITKEALIGRAPMEKIPTLPFIKKKVSKDHQKNLAVASCIQSLLIKDTIEGVDKVSGLLQQSVLISKASTEMKAGHRTKQVNTFLKVEKFKWKHQCP